MKNWMASRQAVIWLSALSLLLFLGRAFYDWRYEMPLSDPEGQSTLIVTLLFLGFTGVWVWGLLGAQQGSRGWVIGLIALNLLLGVTFALVTYFVFCPPGCVPPIPYIWVWNWSELAAGLLAILAAGLHLRAGRKVSTIT